MADGTWRVFKETKNTNSTRNKVKPIDYVDVDSDDEKCTEPNIKSSPESSRTHEPENFKLSFIDLALIDDEEPLTKKYKQEDGPQEADAIQQVNAGNEL